MAMFQAPFALILRYFSQWLDSYGLALIALGLVITIIRVPFDIKSKRSTMKQSVLGPRIKEIQEKHKNNPQKAQMEISKLWKQEGVKPMSGCVWMMLPMFIMIMLFGIIREPLTHLMGLSEYEVLALLNVAERLGIYVPEGIHMQTALAGYIRGEHFAAFQAAVPDAAHFYNINMNFLGLNIGQTPQWNFFLQDNWVWQDLALFFIPIISVGVIYLQQKIMMATNYMQQQMMGQQQQMMKTMMLMMPLMSLWIGFTFPAAMSVYWTASGAMFTLVSIFINRHFKGIYKEMQAEMEAKEKERQAVLEAKRAETERRRQAGLSEENKGTSKKKKQLAEREKERQRQAAQRERDRPEDEEYNPSREGHRKYARGRAYDPHRFERGGASGNTDLDRDDEDIDLETTDIDDTSVSPTLLPAVDDAADVDDAFFDDDADLDDDEYDDFDDDDVYDDED